jgi:hypothetical protein
MTRGDVPIRRDGDTMGPEDAVGCMWWWWIVVVILIITIVWWFFASRNTRTAPVMPGGTTTSLGRFDANETAPAVASRRALSGEKAADAPAAPVRDGASETMPQGSAGTRPAAGG